MFRTEAVHIAGLTGFAVAMGSITDAWGYSFLTALAAWVVWQGREFVRFLRWSERPLARPENTSELWAVPVLRLYRGIAAGRGRARRLITQLRGLSSLAEALPDAAVVIRRTGEIEMFNQAAATFLHLTPNERGNNLVSLIRHPSFSALVAGRVAGDIVEFALPRSPNRHLEARRIVIDSRRLLILARDVTQLNRLLTMRQDFIANVSHELRTPLTVIMGYLEALDDATLSRDELENLHRRMTGPANRMKALVDDLLLLTRLESSPPPSNEQLRPIDVAAMLDDIVADARQLASPAHRISLQADASLRVRAMEPELHSALSNLITNAVRYSPDGGAIDVRWFRDGAVARFEVRDEGVGIPAEHLSRITERFYRVDLAGSRVRGGTGLGLAIAKHVLRRHGATLGVESQLGKGSVFSCTFPNPIHEASEVSNP